MSVFNELEHQEIFHLDVDLRQPIALHCPSPLRLLPYGFFVRLAPELIPALDGIRITAELEGLFPTRMDVTVGAGERMPSKEPGKVWCLAATGEMARGDGTLRFHGVPPGFPRVDLLLCTWPRFVRQGWADDWIACQKDPLWAGSGVPLGGIGTGRVDLCRDGRFRNFSGNNNQDMPFEEPEGLPGAYLSVSEDGVERLLATRPMSGIAPCPSLEFDPAFPQARLTAKSVLPRVDVSVLFSGTLVPHDLKTSSLPAALAEWTVTNHSDAVRNLRCHWSWPNLVGRGGGVRDPEKGIGQGNGRYCFWEAPPEPRAERIRVAGAQGLRFTNAPHPENRSADGEHFLLVIGARACRVGRGVISESVTVPAGGSAKVRMLLAWAMPHWVDSQLVDQGVCWLNQFPAADRLVDHLVGDFDNVLRRAGEWVAFMRSGDLPADISDRLLNCVYPLVTNSVWFKDGRFSVNEGPTEMSGCYGTIDQRLAAHPATQLLFPELNKVELALFRETQSPDGGINHDLGSGNLDRGPSPPRQRWPDLSCSFVIQQARHAWTTGEAGYAKANWPAVRKALEFHGRIADEGGGVAQVGERGTSYDSYHYVGTTAYIATLWLAALRVGRKWALQVGDKEFVPVIDRWQQAAVKKLEADLWNGAFYRAYASPGNPTNENSHAGMLAGAWYSRMLTGEEVLPRERLESCADALLRLNCADRFAVPCDEASTDGRIGSLYGWLPYIEAFLLAPCAGLGDARVLPVWRKMIGVMQRLPCDTRLMYRPQTGEASWGAFYMTAPASWLVYEAWCDFACFPEEGVLRLNPRFEGKIPLVHPRFWAVAEKNGARVRVRFHKVFGGPPFALRHVETPAGRVEIDRGEVREGAELFWRIPP